MKPNILMISGDIGIAYGKKNIFYEMLKEFSKYFNTVHVITGANDEGKSFLIHKNVYIHPSNRNKTLRWDFWTHEDFVYKKALDINKNSKIDLIASHVIPPFFPGTKAAIRLSEDLGVPHFAEVMHIPGYPAAANLTEIIERISVKRFLMKNFEKFTKIRVINKADTKNFLLKLGIPEEKMLEIPAFYLDFQTFKPNPDVKRKAQQFVFAGRFDRNKNVFALLEAFKNISADYKDVKLKIIGDGELKARVEKMVDGMDNIELLGWLPTQKDVAKIYAESAALVMPSFSEGGPRVTLEAMACETLVLSTRVGIMKEVLEDFKNGIVIDFSGTDIEKKMRYVLENPSKARQMANAGMKRVKEFEYHKAIAFYAKTYISEIQ